MSNKTQNARPAKTESALKRFFQFALASGVAYGLGIFAAIGLVFVILNAPVEAPQGDCVPPGNLDVIELQIGKESYRAEVAATSDRQARGLSGRLCLGADQAMLFSYTSPGDYCYWMKDMNFAIDMVWLDADKQITTIESDVRPDTYPTSFCPDRPSQFVVEVPAGTARSKGWSIGQQVDF